MFEGIWEKEKIEEAEFIELLDMRITILYKIAFSYFKDENDAPDAVQDTVIIAYKNYYKLKDRNKFNSWITTILVNKCREILRRNKKIIFEEYDEKIVDVNFTYEGKYTSPYLKVENKIYLINSLNKIDEKYSDIIRLKYFGDYTLDEISTVLDIPLGTVKSRLSFGIKKLREILEVNNNAM